jgi:hypothetical protein
MARRSPPQSSRRRLRGGSPRDLVNPHSDLLAFRGGHALNRIRRREQLSRPLENLSLGFLQRVDATAASHHES